MKRKLLRIYLAATTVMLSISPLMMEVQAAVPITGDDRAGKMPVILVLLGLSAVLIVGVLVFTGKKKK